jgi:hypothetical protein
MRWKGEWGIMEGYCQGKVAGGCAVEPYNSSERSMTDAKGIFPRKREKTYAMIM